MINYRDAVDPVSSLWKVSMPTQALSRITLKLHLCITLTSCATHDILNERSNHPHQDKMPLAVVQNGIIEKDHELSLQKKPFYYNVALDISTEDITQQILHEQQLTCNRLSPILPAAQKFTSIHSLCDLSHKEPKATEQQKREAPTGRSMVEYKYVIIYDWQENSTCDVNLIAFIVKYNLNEEQRHLQINVIIPADEGLKLISFVNLDSSLNQNSSAKINRCCSIKEFCQVDNYCIWSSLLLVNLFSFSTNKTKYF